MDTNEPRTELVYLEPRDRATLDADRAALIDASNRELPLAIETPDQYSAVAALEERLSAFLDRVEPTFDQHVADARKVWQSACKIREAFIETPKRLKADCRLLLGQYRQREEQRRRAEERRIAEDEQRAAEERQRAEAALYERQGQPEAATALLATPVYAPVVELPSAVPEVAGLSFREDWYWQPVGGDTPTNRAKALAMMVKPDYRPFLKLDDGGLTAFAKRTKGTIRVPGIEFRSRQVPVRR